MSLTAVVSSSLPFENGYYQQFGANVPIPVVINVFNSSSQPARIKTIYLTDIEDGSSLGEPNLFRYGVSYAPANNVVPAATTTEVTGTIPVPSGSGNSSIWIALPFQPDTEYTIGSPPLVLGPYIQNLGFYGIDTNVNPPFLFPVYPSTANSSIISVGPTPIFSGAVNLTAALNFTSSVYQYDPNVSQGSLFGQLNNYGFDPPTSSLANQFTYEWWSKLRTYGVPWTGGAQPTTNRGTIWKTFGFPFIEGFGAQIGYLDDGKLYIMMEQDFTAPVSPAFPPYVGLSSSAAVSLNTWVHQAVTRNGAGQVTFWIDGTGSGGGTRSIAQNAHYVNNFNLLCDNLAIPYLTEAGDSPFEGLIENTCDGYFMNLEFSNYCKYTSNFIPPTSSLSAAYGSGGGTFPITSSITTLGSASYNSAFIPQPQPLDQFPIAEYPVSIGAVIMVDNNPNITTSSLGQFRIQVNQPFQIDLVSPFRVWSLADNQRPISNDGFDFQLTTNVVLTTDRSIVAPYAQGYYSSSNTDVAEVIENSDAFAATTSSLNGGFTQLSASGGSVIIKGTGSTELSVWFGPIQGSPAATTTLEVVDALPRAINVYPQNTNVVSGSSYQYTAYLLKSNGSREDITATATWETNNNTLFPIDANGLLEVTGSQGNVIITATSGGLFGSANAVVINPAFQGINQ